MYRVVFRLVVFGTILFSDVLGHGRMKEPPSRASMWRYGFNTPRNYDDTQMWCGGLQRLKRNNGKCGVCGDPWDTKTPRSHEAGGQFATDIIVRSYPTGAVIPVTIDLTANHRGFFEFRICPVTHRGVEVTNECLEKNILVGENGTARFYPGPGNRVFEMNYKLPDGMTCAQCLFQWRYVAGNEWGKCDDGTEKVGCGIQEEFRACADISIGDNVSPLPPRTTTPKPGTTRSGTSTTTHATPSPTEPSVVSERTGAYWLFSLFIVVTTLLVVLAALALLYTYYYHAGRAKKWLMAGNLLPHDSAPVAPPRHKKHPNPVLDVPSDVRFS